MDEGVGQIRDGLAVLSEKDFTECSGAELGVLLVDCEQVQAQLSAVKARVFAAFHSSHEWANDGSQSAAGWLARHGNVAPDQARADSLLARRLRTMPLTAAALAAGEITEAHAQRLARLAHCPRDSVRDHFAKWEEKLVGKARTMDWDRFHRYLDHWANAADPDGAEDKAKDDHQARRAHLSQTWKRMFRLDGWFDPIGGTELQTALRRIERELLEDDWAEARAKFGDNATADGLARTSAQRRADAFVEMARRAMSAPPGSRLPEPLVTVLVGYETLHGRILELLNNGTVVTPSQAGMLLTHADIERIVYEGGSRKICDLGRRTRFFREGLRRIIEIRDRRCTYPGCDRPAENCDVDHILPWGNNGETSQANGRLRCGYHNRNRGPEDPNGNPTGPLTDDDIWDATIQWTNAMVTNPPGSDPPRSRLPRPGPGPDGDRSPGNGPPGSDPPSPPSPTEPEPDTS